MLVGNKLGPSYIVARMQNGAATWENRQLLQMLNMEWPYGPAVLFQGIYPREWKRAPYKLIYNDHNVFHNNQVAETTSMPISRGTDKEVVYPHNGILFSSKKEWTTLPPSFFLSKGVNYWYALQIRAMWTSPKEPIVHDSFCTKCPEKSHL